MKLISWNVNGLRACIQKGFLEQFDKLNADFFCLQETKLQEGQLQLELPGYEQYWCYAEKKGYSGTAIFTKHTPLSVSYGLGVAELDTEGRLITLEYPEFYLVTCYTPNAQRELARIDHRMKWDAAFRNYISALDAKKPTIICGDLNVAHQEIDLKNPGSNRGNAGFSDQERSSFTETLALGFTDTFRYLNPNTAGAYTWWSYMFHAREKNAGWRIDYFLVSDRLKDSVYNTPIYSDILGSDHCPVGLEIDLSCNGSIWSAEPQGKAKVIAPAEKPATKPANIKAIATCAMVCAVFGIGLLAAHTFSDTEAPAVSGSKDLSTANTFPEETLDTAALLKEVSSIGELTGIYIGAADTADFEAKYAELKTRYPALGELKSRENAATALLNRYLYLGASSNIQELQQRPVIEALLSLDFYQQQLTAEEQKTFLTFRRYVLYAPGEEPEISAEEGKSYVHRRDCLTHYRKH